MVSLSSPVALAVDAFRAEFGDRWDTPSGADGKCHVASSLFAIFLTRAGIEHRFVSVRHRTWGMRQNAIAVGDVVFDWTARGNDPSVDGVPHAGRGHNPDAPFPALSTLGDFYAAWGEPITVCPTCGGKDLAHKVTPKSEGRCIGPFDYDDIPGQAWRMVEMGFNQPRPPQFTHGGSKKNRKRPTAHRGGKRS